MVSCLFTVFHRYTLLHYTGLFSDSAACFPLGLIVDLVDQYDGQLCLRYRADSAPCQRLPLFGVFSTRLLTHIDQSNLQTSKLLELLDREGRLMLLPPEVSANQIGLE